MGFQRFFKPKRVLLGAALYMSVNNILLTGWIGNQTNPSRGLMDPFGMSVVPIPTTEQINQPLHASPSVATSQVWKDYKEWHSHESLIRQSHNRSFVIGFYSCPIQAGNRLHDFWNSLIVAVITNRTLLWKYYDEETCQDTNQGYDGSVCRHDTNESDCANVLERASWIPSFDEWAPALGLNTTMGPRNPDYQRGSMLGPTWGVTKALRKRLSDLNRKPSSLSDLEKHPSKRTKWFLGPVIQTSREWFLDEQVPKFCMKRRVVDGMGYNSSSRNVQVFEALYSEGVDFLYGMLYRDTFTYLGGEELEDTPQARALSPPQNADGSSDSITISMHSRHWRPRDSGRVNRPEIICLAKVMRQLWYRKGHDVPSCTIFFMSDRERSLHELSDIARNEFNCTPVVAAHENGNGTGLTREHGPFSGNGFFQDLHYASKARDGYIGHCARSSSQMLQSAIVYDRRMEAWQGGHEHPPSKLAHCCLPGGYDRI